MAYIERAVEDDGYRLYGRMVEPWHNLSWMPFDPRLLPPEAGGYTTPPPGPVKWMSAFPPGRIERALERGGALAGLGQAPPPPLPPPVATGRPLAPEQMERSRDRERVSTSAGDILGIGGLFQGIGSAAQALPDILSAFGAHKGERKAQHAAERLQVLREEAAEREAVARIREAEIEAQASVHRWESAKSILRPVGIGAGILAGLYGVSKAFAWWMARRKTGA